MISKRQVCLFGTHHHFQLAGSRVHPDDPPEFVKALAQAIDRVKPAAVCEEMNLDALKMADVRETTTAHVARSRNIPHAYCDPGTEDRKRLGIEDDTTIELARHTRNWSTRKIREEMARAHAAREAFWLYRIQQVNLWPMLYVCGADHVPTFKRLLLGAEFEITVLRRCWMTGRPYPMPRKPP